jgi:hypothetical protein
VPATARHQLGPVACRPSAKGSGRNGCTSTDDDQRNDESTTTDNDNIVQPKTGNSCWYATMNCSRRQFHAPFWTSPCSRALPGRLGTTSPLGSLLASSGLCAQQSRASRARSTNFTKWSRPYTNKDNRSATTPAVGPLTAPRQSHSYFWEGCWIGRRPRSGCPSSTATLPRFPGHGPRPAPGRPPAAPPGPPTLPAPLVPLLLLPPVCRPSVVDRQGHLTTLTVPSHESRAHGATSQEHRRPDRLHRFRASRRWMISGKVCHCSLTGKNAACDLSSFS